MFARLLQKTTKQQQNNSGVLVLVFPIYPWFPQLKENDCVSKTQFISGKTINRKNIVHKKIKMKERVLIRKKAIRTTKMKTKIESIHKSNQNRKKKSEGNLK